MTSLIAHFANTDASQLCQFLSSMCADTLIGPMLLPWTSGNGSGIPRIYSSITVLGEFPTFDSCLQLRTKI
jgi:hypothetical protein